MTGAKLNVFNLQCKFFLLIVKVFNLEDKQEIAQRLESWILKNFKNKTEFSKKAGMSLQTLVQYTNGKIGIGNKFEQTLKELGCDIKWLKSGRTADSEEGKTIPAILSSDQVEEIVKKEINQVRSSNDMKSVDIQDSNDSHGIPLLLSRFAHGMPSYVGHELQTILRYNDVLPRGTFAAIASGDSMTGADIEEGDVIVYETGVEFESGDIVVAQTDGDDVTVKRIMKQNDVWFLHPENPKHSDIPCTKETRIRGVVIRIIKEVKRRVRKTLR